ncbi:MAG: HAMP domain-containing protein [Thermoanaerobaculia bacterium]|nr:HAMP domain-containing protein [Thermoanaerobaculia bacterium]
MNAAERTSRAAASIRRLTQSVGAKLFTVVFLVLLLNLGFLGYANVRLHRKHLERSTIASARRMNDVIRRSAAYYMLRNDRPALQQMIQTIDEQPTINGLRVYNAEGRVGFSTSLPEIGHVVPLALMPDAGTRIYRRAGERVLGISTPIFNAPSCSNAACHAHPATQDVLGLLDTNMSLSTADADVRAASWQFFFYSAAAIALTLLATGVFVWRFVHRPVRTLRDGTERLGRGELGTQIPASSADELGALATSFNRMSSQLHDAQAQIQFANRTLEERVQRKTAELQSAHEQMIHAEKLTSLGKLAAVVAHEINNPLSGILTYSKLLRKWVERGDDLAAKSEEMVDALALIESESRRCGDIVRNLLTFARAAPMNIANVDINSVVRQCVKLVQHKLDLGNIAADIDLAKDLPPVRGDAGHLEQLLLALVMNAIEAMPGDGNLRITTESGTGGQSVVIHVQDDGVGIPPALLPRLFDPFVTTKEEGKGVGLGLAISRSIVERHNGVIGVESEPGSGTTFTITLPSSELAMAAEKDPGTLQGARVAEVF